jgi:acyl dehydratase
MLPENPSERRFEDYAVGAVFEFGSVALTQDEIVAFARQYDPQDMHTDPALAAAGPHGGIIASGWHTMGVMMRLFTEHYLPKNGLAAPGVDEVRWPRPVFPGDTLRVRVTILEARRSRSKPDRGLVHPFVEVLNQHGEQVLTVKPINMIRCRNA